MKIWLKYQLVIVIIIAFSNCSSQKNVTYYVINELETNIDMEKEKFDIVFFNKNQEDDYYEYTLDDGTHIELLGGMDRGFTEWRYPPYKFYRIYKEFYPNLNLKSKGVRLKNLKIGIWEYYDERGNKIIVNEDEEIGKFGYNQLFVLLNERGYVDIQKSDWKDVIGLGFDSEKKLWKVEIDKDFRRKITIDGNSGKILKTIRVYEIE
jgi:hypothetical protein